MRNYGDKDWLRWERTSVGLTAMVGDLRDAVARVYSVSPSRRLRGGAYRAFCYLPGAMIPDNMNHFDTQDEARIVAEVAVRNWFSQAGGDPMTAPPLPTTQVVMGGSARLSLEEIAKLRALLERIGGPGEAASDRWVKTNPYPPANAGGGGGRGYDKDGNPI
jgi:hypothetical protein